MLGSFAYQIAGLAGVDINKTLSDASPIVSGYRLVANLYVCEARELTELKTEKFLENEPPKEEDLKEWSCVKTQYFDLERHKMDLYHNIIFNDRLRKADSGLYFFNETETEVLVVLSQGAPMEWMKVPVNKLRHVSCSTLLPFTVTASDATKEEAPTALEKNVKLGLMAMAALAVPVLPFIAAGVGVGTALSGRSTKP
jgi:hypothetical protein